MVTLATTASLSINSVEDTNPRKSKLIQWQVTGKEPAEQPYKILTWKQMWKTAYDYSKMNTHKKNGDTKD